MPARAFTYALCAGDPGAGRLQRVAPEFHGGDNRTGVAGLIDPGQDAVGVSSLALERHCSSAELLLRSLG